MTTEPTDAELIAELEAAGVQFMAFRGGLSGTKELWTTSGSQDAKKIATGMRAAIARWGTPQPVVREPLSDAQIKELIADGVFLGNCKEIVRAIERAHGITQNGGSNAE